MRPGDQLQLEAECTHVVDDAVAARFQHYGEYVLGYLVTAADGTLQARFNDSTQQYVNINLTGNELPDALDAIERARANPGKPAQLRGGVWSTASPLLAPSPSTPEVGGGGGGEDSMSTGTSAVALGSAVVRVRTRFQRPTDYCTIGSVLNIQSLTSKQFARIQASGIVEQFKRGDIAPLGGALRDLKIGITFERPISWYPAAKTDRNCHRMLTWLCSAEATGDVLVQVIDTAGIDTAYVLFDCTNHLVHDVDPRHGQCGHPLTSATMQLMGIRGIRRARKVINKPKRWLHD
jgi:hypothetical protein